MSKNMPSGAPTEKWLKENYTGFVTGWAIHVTPAIATEWLKQNELNGQHNRRLRRQHVLSLALEIKTRQWSMTHQGVAFGKSGRLIDGQHRLQAVIEAGIAVPMLVFIDMDESGFSNFDRGAKRGMSDILSANQQDSATAQTIVRLCVRGGGSDVARRAMPVEVKKVLDVLQVDMAVMSELAARQTKLVKPTAPVRAAWLLRHHNASAVDKTMLEEQWRAFIGSDYKRMDETTAAGVRRLKNAVTPRGGSAESEQTCVGWLMFDPMRRDMDKIMIKNASTALGQFRTAVRALLPELVINVPEETVAPRWYPLADPVLGPQLREKAALVNHAKRNGRQEHA